MLSERSTIWSRSPSVQFNSAIVVFCMAVQVGALANSRSSVGGMAGVNAGFLDSIVLSISACHADGPGSISGRGVLLKATNWGEKNQYSDAGTRTRVTWVKARYPNQLDYVGSCEDESAQTLRPNSSTEGRPQVQHASKKMRTPGIEPGAQAWEACMLPLHYERLLILCPALPYLFQFSACEQFGTRQPPQS